MAFDIQYGDETFSTVLPERTRVIRQTTRPLPPVPDTAQAVRDALLSPVAHEPLQKLVNARSTVTIAFDDPIGYLPQEAGPPFREVAVKVLLQELDKLGVYPSNVRLVCAVGLHRKFTNSELATIIGEDLAYRFGPSKLFNHDAEDRDNLVFLGETARHQEVEVNRLVVESDQLIYISQPWSHFNGGWKSVVVGLSSFRSIRHHHRPFAKASGKSSLDPKRSAFPRLLNEMGQVIEQELAVKGRRVLLIEGCMNNATPQQVVQVLAGHPREVHEKGLEVLQQQQVVPVKGQSDVVIYGLGNNRDPYSKMSIINPIQVRNLAMSYSYGLFQNVPLVRKDGILIMCHPCVNQFHPVHTPSYVEVYDRLLPYERDPMELWELYAEEFAHRPEYIHKYRYGHAFHGAHPFILFGQGLYGFKHAGRVFLAGARDKEAARRVGFEPFDTLDEAIGEAERTLGSGCSISYPDMPQNFVCDVEE
jgi:nickel-dependent lactate racemase